MSEFQKLRVLARAIHGPGSTIEMLRRWREFESACHPKLIVELVDENAALKAENEALRSARAIDLPKPLPSGDYRMKVEFYKAADVHEALSAAGIEVKA